VLDENQSPTRLENPPQFSERRDRIWDGAQGPGHYDRIEDRIRKREVFRRSSEQRHRDDHISRPSTCEPEQFGGWIETNDAGDCPAIERQVHPRPDADLKNQTSRPLDRSLGIMVEQPVTHGEVEQAGHDPMLVKPYHRDLRGHSSSVHTDTCAGDDRDQGRDWKGFDRTNLVTVEPGMASSAAG